MLEKLRKPFFFTALGVMALVLLMEAGAVAVLGGGVPEPVQTGGAGALGIGQTENLPGV